MNSYKPVLGAVLALTLGFAVTQRAQAEDLDLFVGAAATTQNPNVLVIIDNSANWSSASQHWDGGVKQGQSELRALRTVAGELTDKVNFGLMMFTEGSGSNAPGGYVRYHIRPMDATNKAAFVEMIGPDTGCVDNANSLNGTPNCIYKNFDSPSEKTGTSKTDYSAGLFEAFKYFGGHTTPARAHLPNPNGSTPVDTVAGPTATHFGPVRYSGNPDAKTDKAAFSDPFTTYGPPITDDTSCGKNYIIFIGNGFPNQDMAGSILNGVGGSDTQLAMPVLSTISITETLQDESANVITSCGSGGNASNRLSNCTANISQTLKDTFTHHTNFACIAPESIDLLKCVGVNNRKFSVQATRPNVVSQTGSSAVPASSVARNTDEWAQFLYTTDVNAAEGQQNAKIYTIDVFKDAQDARQTSLLFNMARVGGGGYFQATNEQDIINAIREILVNIQALNSVFASASLPINATNRSQNENQVFIGMFRPDADAKPRWYGNLKRYQIALIGEEAKLADSKGADAVSTETGFIRPCAESFWSSDSDKYWDFSQDSAGLCTTSSTSVFSDLPDGSNVEKGATAEVVRKGNSPPTTDTTPTNKVNRTIYTCSKTSACKFGEAMDAFNATNVSQAALGAADAATHLTLVDWIRGVDVDDENKNDDFADVRPSVHGDVAHSRPLPVNYGALPASDGGDTGVVMYYGANDGNFRAVRGRDGKELWSFIAPEHHAKLERLRTASPLVLYPNMEEPLPTPTPTRKDYFFDGSAGLFQNIDNSKVWVFPSMRRGGRMLYGFDVTNPELPTMKWRVGCPNLLDDTDCTSGFEAIGQTWSVPSVALVKGHSATSPVIITGGGYDRCEDNDFPDPTDSSNTSLNPVCDGQKGATAFVIDADTGNLLQSFTGIRRSVAGDVTLVARNTEGFADHGYIADTGGGLYRIDFVDPTTLVPLKAGEWVLTHIAQAEATGFRKFLFGPATFFNAGKVFLTIGSGDRERPLIANYPYRERVLNRFYMYVDTFATTGLPVNLDDTTLMNDFSSGSDCKTKMSAGSNGWFIDLAAGQGEQTVTASTIFGGLAFFSTNFPDPGIALGTCGNNLGEARGYVLNLLNASGAADTQFLCGGARSASFAGGGLPPSPVTGTVPVGPNGTPITVMIGGANRGGGVSTPIGASRVTPTITQRRSRIYWYLEGDK